MLTVTMPQPHELAHLVLDFNGTLACDGRLLPGVAERLQRLARDLEVHVLTADTFGSAAIQLQGIPCKVQILGPVRQAEAKRDFVQRLGPAKVACVGNGRNDVLMLETAALGIAVLQVEGATPQALLAADVLAPDIAAALDLLLIPQRLKATLRS